MLEFGFWPNLTAPMGTMSGNDIAIGAVTNINAFWAGDDWQQVGGLRGTRSHGVDAVDAGSEAATKCLLVKAHAAGATRVPALAC